MMMMAGQSTVPLLAVKSKLNPLQFCGGTSPNGWWMDPKPSRHYQWTSYSSIPHFLHRIISFCSHTRWKYKKIVISRIPMCRWSDARVLKSLVRELLVFGKFLSTILPKNPALFPLISGCFDMVVVGADWGGEQIKLGHSVIITLASLRGKVSRGCPIFLPLQMYIK